MRQYSKQWRLSAIMVLKVVAILALTSKMFGQGQPGESGGYTNEQVACAGNLRTNGTLAEARNGGNQLDVWRADTPGFAAPVWLSLNHGCPFTIGNTATFASPAVVPFDTSSFMVFHTGTDGRIYWTVVLGNGFGNGPWISIPGQTTPNNMSVSVAPIGQGSLDEYVVYRGSGNDTRIFGTWVNDAGNWASPINIAGGLAVAPPAICLDSAASSFWVAAIGLDNQVWTTYQPLGAKSWPNWTPQGQFTGPHFGGEPIPGPGCAATDNGNVALAYVDTGARPHYAVFNNGGGLVTGWTGDITGWQTYNAVQLTSSGNAVWSLLTAIETACGSIGTCDNHADQTYWKTVYVVP